ncbi:hypothetical protein BBO_07295 [Beauveria brongniartii RCEF 3172]|uniref:25S rRNA (Uridine(2843)-N(3))-methyltransferase n=1 Tax=Beauveria brongniartii RCEF 3172 TaxID=1081107 RepID=A0A166ZH80_9HYPO|nr:hypothetical protein BBO_07295 [Beauveria brongniartii RCEF 3172]
MKKKPSGGGPTTSPSPLAATTTTSRNADDAPPPPPLSIPQQQRLLNHFAAAFAAALGDANLPQRLQAIKQALYRRDFAAAFGREDHLAAYAARWSPTRALCYAAIFQHYLAPHIGDSTSSSSSQSSAAATAMMICHPAAAARGSLTLLDSAPWAGVASTMQATLTTPLPLSKHASAAAAAAANAPPLLSTPSHLRLRVLQQDALELTKTQWADVMTAPDEDAAAVVVVTLLFTLNELYTSGGVGKTTRFLGALEAALPDGALLLVVDSPGSYSEAAVGKDRKKYPMQWLLHHTLTERAGATAREWTRLESHDSLWFRLSDQLTYPIQLENMRYQLHLYRIDRTSPT